MPVPVPWVNEENRAMIAWRAAGVRVRLREAGGRVSVGVRQERDRPQPEADALHSKVGHHDKGCDGAVSPPLTETLTLRFSAFPDLISC